MDFFENKKRNYLKETLCLIESILWLYVLVNFMKKGNQLLLWIYKLRIGLYLQSKSQQKPKTGPNSKQRKIKKQKKSEK